MKVKMDVRGFAELIDQVERMGKAGTRVANAALRYGGEPIVEEAVKNARAQLTERSSQGIAAIKARRIYTREGRKVMPIGIDKGDISKTYYMKFHELGSSHESPKPFLQPAFEAKKEEAMARIVEKLREGVKP